MNTPDTEMEKECYFDLIEAITDVWHKQCGERAAFPLTDMREAIQPIIQKALSSRDTYWKERVRKEVEGIHRKHYLKWIPTEEQKGYRKAQLDILQALDNFK